MSLSLSPALKQRYFDSNGNPLAGGKLYTYQSGTSTPQATYTDSGGMTPNANPVILDASGEANVWLDQALSYKFVLKDSADATQWTVDGIIGILTTGAVSTSALQDGSVTGSKIADGVVTSAKLSVSVVTKASNYTATSADDVILSNATSAAFDVTLPTAVGISGKTYRIKKIDSSVNAVTILTTSSQTIDGLTSKSLAAENIDISVISDGANWKMIGGGSTATNQVQAYATPGAFTWTKPASVTATTVVKITCTGGGGAGGRGGNNGGGGGGGGGAGGTAVLWIAGSSLGATESFTVAAAQPTTSGNGNSSLFGSLLTATGGAGGVQGTNSGATAGDGGTGGTSTGGTMNLSGGSGTGGGWGSVGATPGNGGGGGSSFWGGGGAGAAGNTGNSGGGANVYGAGGGGGNSAGTGGGGAGGLVVVEWFG